MAHTDDRIPVAVLAVPESTASTLYGMFEILESAGRDWTLLTTGRPGTPALRPLIVSADGRPFRAANGLHVEPTCAIADCPAPAAVTIPDLLVAPADDLRGRHPAEAAWLHAQYAAGAMLATACTGALVLAEAGLLDGQDATTHWAYCDAMTSAYPEVRLHPDRALVVSGEGQRLVMAGGGTSWHDLALYLIARLVSGEEAMRVARLHLLDWHHLGQQPFAALVRTRHTADAAIAAALDWIAAHYRRESPVAGMVAASGLAERSFARRFTHATGMPPLEYVHALRLEEAKQLLETTSLPIDEIAARAGYEDATFLARLFRRKVGLTPAQYRKRFGGLRQALAVTEAHPSTAQAVGSRVAR